jgi:hypothetical protein
MIFDERGFEIYLTSNGHRIPEYQENKMELKRYPTQPDFKEKDRFVICCDIPSEAGAVCSEIHFCGGRALNPSNFILSQEFKVHVKEISKVFFPSRKGVIAALYSDGQCIACRVLKRMQSKTITEVQTSPTTFQKLMFPPLVVSGANHIRFTV